MEYLHAFGGRTIIAQAGGNLGKTRSGRRGDGGGGQGIGDIVLTGGEKMDRRRLLPDDAG